MNEIRSKFVKESLLDYEALANSLKENTSNAVRDLLKEAVRERYNEILSEADENEFEVALNEKYLAKGVAGRFALYPTTNNWTFLLLDTLLGDVYHVQWSQDASNRGLYKIPSI